jgi:hypothetical protein
MAGWGSREWVGVDLRDELGKSFRTVTFNHQEIALADLYVVVKQAPSLEWVEGVRRRGALIYCPVDFYGSAAEIDADRGMLRRCSRIVVDCERLRRYFEGYAPVQYMDHHVKLVSDPGGSSKRGQTPTKGEGVRPLLGPRNDSYLLWIGVRTNVPAGNEEKREGVIQVCGTFWHSMALG